MKKIALYIPILFILLIFLSCGGGGGGSSKGSSQITLVATFKDVSATVGIKATTSTLANIRYTVSGPGMETIRGIAPVVGNMVEFTLAVPNGPQRLFVIEALDALDNVKYAGSAQKDLDGTPISVEIILSYNPLVGTWGYVRINHENGGDWESSAGKLILNADGTGSNSEISNDFDDSIANEQIAGTFTYSVERSQDGSLLLKSIDDTDGEMNFHRILLSDDFKLMFFDYTVEIDDQNMLVAVRMDPSRTYSNADLYGEYFKIGYAHEASAGAAEKFISDSSIFTFDGIGNISIIGRLNGDGVIHDLSNSHTYTVNPEGLVRFDNGGFGYISGDNKLFVRSVPDTLDAFRIRFGLKKGDRIYSTADLAGTWVLASFGDGNNGSSFFTHIGMWTCDSSGNCTISGRRQVNGVISPTPDSRTFSVAPDGSFGASFAENMPSYVAAIGDNGNVFIMNRSFGDSTLRRISIGARCNSCSNIAELTGISGKWLIYRTPQGGTEVGPACVYITQTGNLFIMKGYSYSGFDAGGSINGNQIQFEAGLEECDKEAHGPATGVLNENAMNGTYTKYGGCGYESGTWRAEKGECPEPPPQQTTAVSVRTAQSQNGYRLDFYVDEFPVPHVTSASVTGPNIGTLILNYSCNPVGGCSWYADQFIGQTKPTPGVTYAFTINYDNGFSETLSDTLSDINVGFPILVSPQDGAVISTTTPTFVWQAPSFGCAAWYHLIVSDNAGNPLWWPHIPGGTTSSAVYNFDGSALMPLEVGKSYTWGVNAIDDCLNENDGHDNFAGTFGGTFTVQ